MLDAVAEPRHLSPQPLPNDISAASCHQARRAQQAMLCRVIIRHCDLSGPQQGHAAPIHTPHFPRWRSVLGTRGRQSTSPVHFLSSEGRPVDFVGEGVWLLSEVRFAQC